MLWYIIYGHIATQSIRNVLLFSERMFLVVHITFPRLSENATFFNLQQANISLHSQKVQNDVFLKSLEKNHCLFLLDSDNQCNAGK